MAKKYYTEDYIQQQLPEGFKAWTNPATGNMTVTAPSGATLTVKNSTNAFNIPSTKDTYTVAGKDFDVTGNIAYVYTFNQSRVNEILNFVKDNSNKTEYNINDKTYVSSENPTLNSSNPTEAANMNSIYSYLKDTGVTVAGIITNPDGGYIVTYVGADGKEYEYPVAAPDGDTYRDAELNSQLLTLISREGSVDNTSSGSGSGSGSGYSSGPSAQTIAANATVSNAILDQILNGTHPSVNASTAAKQDFALTEADYAALRAQFPNYSDEQLTNIIANSDWAKNFGATLNSTPTTSALNRTSYEDYMATAKESNDASKVIANATLNQNRNNLLEEIANDPELYNAIATQLRADSASGVTAGQRVANVLNTARATNDAYKAAADELYSKIGGTGEDSVAGGLRSSVYNSLINAYGGYTEQQLNALATDTNLQTTDVQNLITALSLINTGLQSEDAQIKRAAEAEAARIVNEARDRESKAAQESAASIAAANANTELATTLTNLAGQVAGGNVDLTGADTSITHGVTDYGTGTYNTPEYTQAPLIDESLYNTLLSEDYLKFLSPETFARFTNQKSEADIAAQYGLLDLMSADAVANKFIGFQQQANAESDKTFNEAQRAYIMAIAAGDAKTAEQLTRLAQTAGMSRKNLYGASALANQFAQQRANAAVSNNLRYDRVQQQALNNASIANATQSGRQQWNAWVGDGNSNASGNGFSNSYNRYTNNVTNATAAYKDLIGGAMNNQSSYNNTVNTLNNDSNSTLSQYAAALNTLNTNAATTNTQNSAIIAGIKNNAEVQKLINNANK
jgi:DNA-binding phage protein